MKSLRRPSLLCVIAGLAAAPAASAADPLLAPTSACDGQRATNATPARQEAALRCLVTWARREAGRRSVRVHGKLERSAQAKANLIARCGVLSHSPCGQPWNRVFTAAGFHGSAFENLAAGSGRYASARSAVSMWLGSAGHREAMLSPQPTVMGVGVRLRTKVNGWRGTVWVLHLGRP